MSSPWIQSMVKALLGTENHDNQSLSILGKGKVVQVVGINTNFNFITVSDKANSISVFLTPQCVDTIENINNYSIADLKYCQVRIEQYHLSTVAQCASHMDLGLISKHVTFPFAFQCAKLTYLGANDCDVVGSPGYLF